MHRRVHCLLWICRPQDHHQTSCSQQWPSCVRLLLRLTTGSALFSFQSWKVHFFFELGNNWYQLFYHSPFQSFYHQYNLFSFRFNISNLLIPYLFHINFEKFYIKIFVVYTSLSLHKTFHLVCLWLSDGAVIVLKFGTHSKNQYPSIWRQAIDCSYLKSAFKCLWLKFTLIIMCNCFHSMGCLIKLNLKRTEEELIRGKLNARFFLNIYCLQNRTIDVPFPLKEKTRQDSILAQAEPFGKLHMATTRKLF